MNKRLIILILGIILGVILMPIVALIAFVFTTTFSRTMTSLPPHDYNISKDVCMGTDENSGDFFTGFLAKDDDRVCILQDIDGNITQFDSNIESEDKGDKKKEDYIYTYPSGSEDGTIDVQATLLFIGRLVLYCSVCMVFVLPIASIAYFFISKPKKSSVGN